MSDGSREELKDGSIRVVVADDHQVVREGLRMILEILGEGFTLVGEAADGTTALQVVEHVQPDVVLMDLRMPGMDGLETIRQIHARWPHIAIIILTTYNEDELMMQGLRAGACSYLLKDTTSDTLFQTIRSAARGETLLQPEIMARLLSQAPSSTPTSFPVSPVGTLDLTEREREILAGVAQGERSKEIAFRLGITTHTVATHLTNIYAKLGVDSRTSAVVVAIERGLLPRHKHPQ